MSQSLAFHEALWASAKSFATQGNYRQALLQLQPLLHDSAELPAKLQLNAHRLAGRIYLSQEKFKHARRMFWAALRLDRTCSATWFDLGQAFENDPYGCDERAGKCYKKAVLLAAGNAKFDANLGRNLIRRNKVKSGVKWLKKVAKHDNVEPAILEVVIGGLLEANRPTLAQQLLQPVRFLRPLDRTVQRLWNSVRFACSSQIQKQSNPASRLIPFLKIAGSSTAEPVEGGILRLDQARSAAPHLQSRTRGKRG